MGDMEFEVALGEDVKEVRESRIFSCRSLFNCRHMGIQQDILRFTKLGPPIIRFFRTHDSVIYTINKMDRHGVGTFRKDAGFPEGRSHFPPP
jgi:hypothetical protein